MHRISVIVPMYNEARHIGRTLDSVLRAARVAGVDCELIVVDNGSIDQGPQQAREMGARVLLCPGLSIGALRNRGAAVASGDSLAFLDADIEVPEDWLQLWQLAQGQRTAEVFALDCAAPSSRAVVRPSLAATQPGRRDPGPPAALDAHPPTCAWSGRGSSASAVSTSNCAPVRTRTSACACTPPAPGN
ncbi:glycosyltransferase family 2 protein [Pseudomonas piscis]|uniref:glycosyltransferase family 2 protein n=1 Tax=Pseudomonas piscis TaxID=2614538 RepID=UPI0003B3FBBA|nr:hypothetical protein P308_16420 [Pseudomonas piscis]